jgi:hypothetical protein
MSGAMEVPVAYSVRMATRSDLNVVRVGDREFLLTVGGGEAVHLAREAEDGEEKVAAAPDHYLGDLEAAYDRAALEELRWLGTALCGRRWILMASGEDSVDDDAVFAPTCRSCLALMDKLFPEPVLDPRFAVVVQVLTDTVVEYGTAEILGVPGDQQAALRREVRAAVRKRTGHGMQTYAHENMVVFVCQPVYDQHAGEHARMAAEAIDRAAATLLGGEPVTPMLSPMRLFWEAWAVG